MHTLKCTWTPASPSSLYLSNLFPNSTTPSGRDSYSVCLISCQPKKNMDLPYLKQSTVTVMPRKVGHMTAYVEKIVSCRKHQWTASLPGTSLGRSLRL